VFVALSARGSAGGRTRGGMVSAVTIVPVCTRRAVPIFRGLVRGPPSMTGGSIPISRRLIRRPGARWLLAQFLLPVQPLCVGCPWPLRRTGRSRHSSGRVPCTAWIDSMYIHALRDTRAKKLVNVPRRPVHRTFLPWTMLIQQDPTSRTERNRKNE
jgi:hypothetical protein